jgi:hypothetical protein
LLLLLSVIGQLPERQPTKSTQTAESTYTRPKSTEST